VNLLSDGEAQEFYLVLRHRKDDQQSEVYLIPPYAYEDKARAIDMEFDALLVPMLKVSVDGLILKANALAERLLSVANFEGLMLQNLLEGLGRPISDWLLDAQRGRGQNHPKFLQLKRSEQEEPTATPKARAPNTAVRPMRKGSVILLVADETTVRTFASRALKLRGFDVIEAASGEEALEVLEGNQRKIDLFVSDVVMPGMDGPTWVKKARVLHPKVNVIFVSGYAEDSFDVEQAKIEHSTFLPKPFFLKQLIAAVDDQLNHLDPSEEGEMVHAAK